MQLLLEDRIGNYRLDRVLGSMRTGVVYQATHLMLPRRALVKVMHPDQPDRQQIAVQLLREACMLEALQHPGVPPIFEAGVLADRRPWFAFGHIGGVTLAELSARGPLDPLEVAAVVRDAADVLAYAHRRGVVHRGLRPDRIVLSPARRFTLCIPDWSEARPHDAAVEVPITVPGTSHYLAPEFARGDAIDDRADVFSLGVIAYLAVTGVRPFARGQYDPHVPTRARRGDVPRQLATLIDQMLAPDRFDRPSAAELCAELSERVTDVLQVHELATAPLRIRRPRWTPPIPLANLPTTALPARVSKSSLDDGWADDAS